MEDGFFSRNKVGSLAGRRWVLLQGEGGFFTREEVKDGFVSREKVGSLAGRMYTFSLL